MPPPTQAWTHADVEAFLPRKIRPVRPRFLYAAGLLLVATALLILQALYLALVALAGYATFLYIAALPGILASVSINFLTIFVLVTPPVTGAIVTFFLLKPLFAKVPDPPELFHLDPATEPVLFALVQRICLQLGAPHPTRIEIDLSVNASARFRRGWRSFFSHDLVLTLGLPLTANLTVTQFTAVVAHEFGHFSQHLGLRLGFLIGSIRHWFARVAWQRDDWDENLDDWRSSGGWRTQTIFGVAWATVQASRYILRGLLWCANIITCWFSRQMEFDADRHAAALVGAEALAATLTLLPVLAAADQQGWHTANQSLAFHGLCDDFSLLVRHISANIPAEIRSQIVAERLRETTGRWSDHPSTSDRIQSVARITGVANPSNSPATALFADFNALSRRQTSDVYRNTLGETLSGARLIPAQAFVAAAATDTRRATAIAGLFGPSKMPFRWFRMPETPLNDDTLQLTLTDHDETQRYGYLLDLSLNHYGALHYIRAGGKINSAPFNLPSAAEPDVAREEASSRDALLTEIGRLRQLFHSRGHLFTAVPEPWLTAWSAFSASQSELLNLRYYACAVRIARLNGSLLSQLQYDTCKLRQERRISESIATLRRILDVPCPPLYPDYPAQTVAASVLPPATPESAPGALSAEDLAFQLLGRADMTGAALLGEICLLSQTNS